MKKNLSQHIKIPEGVEISFKDGEFFVKGTQGEISKKINLGKVKLEKKEKEIILSYEKSTKREKKIINTSVSHIKNMIKGVQEKFEYKLKVCSSHFPITVKVEGGNAIIKNFLGEKVDRKVKIPGGAEVNVQKDIIIITSPNKEIAGQTAANFENATKIKKRDRRIFQDGIYIINKAGKEI